MLRNIRFVSRFCAPMAVHVRSFRGSAPLGEERPTKTEQSDEIERQKRPSRMTLPIA